MLQRTEWLMLLATFLMGVVMGTIVYFTGFAPLGIGSADRPTGTAESFSVIAEERGMCENSDRGCGSYRVSGNRDYRFVRATFDGEITATREGLLSNNVFLPLVEVLNQKLQLGDLEVYPDTPPSCVNAAEQAIRYRIEIAGWGTIYVATCDPTLASDDALLEALSAVSAVFPF